MLSTLSSFKKRKKDCIAGSTVRSVPFMAAHGCQSSLALIDIRAQTRISIQHCLHDDYPFDSSCEFDGQYDEESWTL